MKKIVVTGGSGASGSVIVEHLLAQGYAVLNLDRMPPREERAPFVAVDLTDYGMTFAAMHGCEAVVHFGSNPHPDNDFVTGAARFHNNTLATFIVFQAAAALGMARVVWASSETVFGYPYQDVRPQYAPIDDEHPLRPQNGYAMSKVVCEELARQMNARYGLPIIGLRFSNIHYTGTWHPHNYEAVPSYWADPLIRRENLWSYIDARDAAEAVRLSLEAEIETADNFIIAAADTINNRPSAELMAAVYPGVPIREGLGEFESLINSAKAQRVLGFKPQHSWRDEV